MYTRAELADEVDTYRRFRCSACEEICEIDFVDNGIGPYEYWGAPGRHTQIDIESRCCGRQAYEV